MKKTFPLFVSLAISVASFDAIAETYFTARSDAIGRSMIELGCAEVIQKTETLAEAGVVEEQLNLAAAHRDGLCVDKARDVAMSWYQKAADAGSAEAQRDLALLLWYGSTEAGHRLAINWFRRAADGGDAYSMLMLGRSHHYGRGRAGVVDKQAALDWYKKSADAGEDEGMFVVAKIYETGDGVAVDMAQAIGWYERAAKVGHPLAQAKMAQIYFDGVLVPKNNAKAFEYFEAAATKKQSESILGLSRMYRDGLGVKRDLVKAYALLLYKWGSSEMEREREELRLHLTGAQVIQAESMYKNWSYGQKIGINPDEGKFLPIPPKNSSCVVKCLDGSCYFSHSDGTRYKVPAFFRWDKAQNKLSWAGNC